jgi:hypothetical protein
VCTIAAVDDLQESNRQFIQAWQHFARQAKAGRIEDRDGVSVAFSGVAMPLMNMMFLSSPVIDAADLQARIQVATTIGQASGQVWMLTICDDWLPSEVRARAAAMLAASGLAPSSSTTGMVADNLAPPRRPAPPRLAIRSVESLASCTPVADLNTAAYHMPIEWGREAFARQEMFGTGVWADVGYLDEVAVSTATAAVIDERLYVMLVATAADHMNRGYAEAVIRHSLARATAATGLRRTVLHATPAGEPLYTSMGYRATSRFTMYLAAPAAD